MTWSHVSPESSSGRAALSRFKRSCGEIELTSLNLRYLGYNQACAHRLRPEAVCKPTACPAGERDTDSAVIPEIYRELFMPEASDKDVMMWFPAITAESPQLSFSILSAVTNRRSHEQMKTGGRKVLFMATEAWLGQQSDSTDQQFRSSRTEQ